LRIVLKTKQVRGQDGDQVALLDVVGRIIDFDLRRTTPTNAEQCAFHNVQITVFALQVGTQIRNIEPLAV
jgi:hypothetical protein